MDNIMRKESLVIGAIASIIIVVCSIGVIVLSYVDWQEYRCEQFERLEQALQIGP